MCPHESYPKDIKEPVLAENCMTHPVELTIEMPCAQNINQSMTTHKSVGRFLVNFDYIE